MPVAADTLVVGADIPAPIAAGMVVDAVCQTVEMQAAPFVAVMADLTAAEHPAVAAVLPMLAVAVEAMPAVVAEAMPVAAVEDMPAAVAMAVVEDITSR
jgi:hypothetical protein